MRAPPARALAALLVPALLLAGCLGPAGRVAPDPIEAEPPECPVRDEAARLAAWRAGVRRTGYRPCAEVPREVELAFRLPGVNPGDHTAAKASPVPANGTWVVAGDAGVLRRVSAEGRELWSAATGPSTRGIHGTPAVANGTVYVGAYDGALYAFDLATGEREWRTRLGGSIGSSPAAYGGEVYVAVETPEPDGHVSIVDRSTGEETWRSQLPTDHPHSSVAIAPGADRFAVGANDGTLYAWNLSTRERAWTFETGGPIKGPVAVHEGAAFFGSWDDRVYRVDLAGGTEDWRFETGDDVMSGPAVDPRSGSLVVSSLDGNAYALDLRDGSLRWRAPLGGPALSSPTLADGLVLVGSHAERLHALDLRDGSQVWSYEADGQVTSTPAPADGRVAFATRADEHPGRLHVLKAAGGTADG